MVPLLTKDEWSYAMTTMNGAQYVMMNGVKVMPLWPVNKLASN